MCQCRRVTLCGTSLLHVQAMHTCPPQQVALCRACAPCVREQSWARSCMSKLLRQTCTGAGGALQSVRSVHAQAELGALLLVDAMGSFSPIAAQARAGRKPDSVVLLVGSCARGLPESGSADLLYSFTPISRCLDMSLFLL